MSGKAIEWRARRGRGSAVGSWGAGWVVGVVVVKAVVVDVVRVVSTGR